MAENYVGFNVSIECQNSDFYQGQIMKVDPGNQTLTLKQVFRNGMPLLQAEVNILANEIVNLKIISKATDSTKRDFEFKTPKPKAQSSLSSKMARQASVETRTPQRDAAQSPAKTENTPTTPSKMRKNRERFSNRDDACFFTPINLKEDFDFEGNLALFNKQEVLGDIEKSSQGYLPPSNSVPKYRHDENVIEAAPPVFRQIRVPLVSSTDFFTDSNLVVPSISPELRLRFENLLRENGFSSERRSELTARSVVEVALQLVGGPHRLTPKNAHQRPVVAVICGTHPEAGSAVCSARHLAALGLKTYVHLDAVPTDPTLMREIALYKLTNEVMTFNLSDMPQNVDLIVASLLSPTSPSVSTPSLRGVVEWANRKKAPVMALDQPPADTITMATQWLDIKCTLAPELPLNYTARDGRLYLYSLGIPRKIYSQLGISYESPFGSKCVITLHAAP